MRSRKKTTESRSPADGRRRLQRILADAGFGSRRGAEQLLRDGRVTVNGAPASLGDSADPTLDVVALDGERVRAERLRYWMLNKPRGVLTTLRDPHGRRTVADFLPPKAGPVVPVGRLDLESEGLLLFTNDGTLSQRLLHPSHGNEREYRVTVRGAFSEAARGRLERGIVLEEGRTAPARVSKLDVDERRGTSVLHLTLVEGRKRQIRRSLQSLGFPVKRLARVRIGPLTLGRLAVGAVRELRDNERRALLAHAEALAGPRKR